eukprot:10873356-Alexandrium_andersonii.AAC.1
MSIAPAASTSIHPSWSSIGRSNLALDRESNNLSRGIGAIGTGSPTIVLTAQAGSGDTLPTASPDPYG